MNFGVSWWGRNWMHALNGAGFANRIPRGKSYANTGKVYDIDIAENNVTAKVKGRFNEYYDTQISFKKFSKEEKKIILDTINAPESILASLLNHELPEELYKELLEQDINVFPTSVDNITPSCNCPDYAYICKHVAGLVYMIVHEVDKDPFNIFKLQGCDLLKLLDYNTTSDNIKSTKELFDNEDTVLTKDTSNADFTQIPDLMDLIFKILSDKPLFYDKNFKELLAGIYKSTARYVKKNVDDFTCLYNNTYNPFIILERNDTDYTLEDENDVDSWMENIFLKRWHNPNQWNTFNINIDSNYEINITNSVKDTPFEYEEKEHLLFSFLTELNDMQLSKFNENIRELYDIYQFTLELIKKHALIPELFKNEDYYYIRWIPAVFDEKISKIIEELSSVCPDNLITFNDTKISRKDQIISAVSIITKGLFDEYILYGSTKAFKKVSDNSVVRLFFYEGQNFDSYDEQNYENLINQWLSKFIINSRNYDLFIVIEEDNASFEVSVQVKVGDGEILPIHKVIKETEDDDLKVQLISDSYLINELFPNLHTSIDLNENLTFDINDFSEFFINTLPLFELIGIQIILPKNLQKAFKPKLVLDIASTKNERSYITFEDLSKFDWKIAIGDRKYDVNEFKKLSVKSEGLVKLANDYVILDENDTKSLIKQIDKLPEKLNRHELLKATLSGELNGAKVNIDEKLQEMIDNFKKQENVNLPNNINADLRKYQKIGYSWLLQNIKTGFGSILADDMGLGKTLQVLTTILHLKQEGYLEKEKVLVVAPTSLLTNWQQEIKHFTPTLTSYIYHGPHRKLPKEEYDIYLTSYGVIRQDESKIKKKKWFLFVVDEAQNIKNSNTKQTKAIKSIKAKHKIALSGTPVENRLAEYWSIFDFTNRGYLSGLKNFRKNYIFPIEKERSVHALEQFKQITEPFILRRVKNDKNVIKDLPDKITNDIYCNLTSTQSALYQEVLNAALDEVNANEGMKRKGLVLKLINSLKQICNHPTHFTKVNEMDIKESGKMEVLINILENILDADEKVLIFTQYVEMGNIMKKLIEDKFKMEVLFLHGSLSRKKRDELINNFQNNSQNKIFILSLKAGGTGLNLTAASNVIHYDLWWNPAVENQATDRAYRIGQKENVMVYRFITKGTFEEKINEMIIDKKELAELTVNNGEKFITEMNDEELKEILSLRDN